MSIERFETGPRMSQAVCTRDTVYLAGQVGEGTSVTAQTESILANIDRLLALAGSDKTMLLSANIWLRDIRSFAEMNAVWEGWVAPGHTPARATVQAEMAAPEILVEIMVTAAR